MEFGVSETSFRSWSMHWVLGSVVHEKAAVGFLSLHPLSNSPAFPDLIAAFQQFASNESTQDFPTVSLPEVP
jgi:hypothetical protein